MNIRLIPKKDMTDHTAEHLIENLITLPTIPTALAKLNTVIEDPDSSAQDIASVVSTDQSVAIKVLRISNSTFYGLRAKVTSLPQAVSILGTRVIRNLVLQATTIQAYQHLRGHADFDIDEFWEHSITTAYACQILAKKTKTLSSRADEYYAIGLIHDIGRVILLDSRMEDFLASVRWAKASGESTADSETRIFGFNHTHVGEMLAKRWKLSDEVAAGILYHHSPVEGGDAKKIAGCLVHVADQLSHNLRHQPEDAAVGLDPLALDLLGIPVEATPSIVEEIAALATNLEV